MADWHTEPVNSNTINHVANLPPGKARVEVTALAASQGFTVRVFIARAGAPDEQEDFHLRPGKFAGPSEAAEWGKAAAEKKFG